MPIRHLTPSTTLDNLRREARRLLREAASGDLDGLDRIRASYPNHHGHPKLRQAQQVLAREHGFPNWAALKQEVEDRQRTHADRVILFLEKGVHRYGVDPRTGKWGGYERDGDQRGAIAARLLSKHPEIARENIHTAVLAHDFDAVRGFLAKDASLANDLHPFDNWRPLARLGYARLPIAAVDANALPIARLLLDAGADPHSAGSADAKSFTVLTGVIGGGEAGQSPHPQAEALARLLIERGADPLDGQALYDTSLGDDDTFWLNLMWTESMKRGDNVTRWHTEIPNTLGPPLEYLLGNAVPRHPKRVAWLLAHGADATTTNHYSKQPVARHAALAGATAIIDMLVRHGAERPELGPAERFIAAAVAGDIPVLRALAEEQPGFLKLNPAMSAAVNADNVAAAEALLDLGMSPDIGDERDFRALHLTTHAGAANVARLLIARGAEIDALETRYNSTAFGHAVYQQRPDMIALLAPLSRDIASLCSSGSTARLRQLLTEDRTLTDKPGRWGEPPLLCLPDTDEAAAEIVDLLLAFGADRSVRNKEGQTPAEAARKRGLEDTAMLLEP
jgi:ankyrin repeat protein